MAARLKRDEALIFSRRETGALADDDWTRLVLPIDKPGGLSSFDVIRRLRRVAPIRKIGHAGTLDPMATGLLICLSGRATKLMELFMGEKKLYTGVIRLGQETPSYDAETDVSRERSVEHVTDEALVRAASGLTGEIVQITPAYSAVKVEGERLYKKARRGERPTRPPRHVSVHKFDVQRMDERDVRFEVECSSGTYIRSLAHDLGQTLDVGGHLVELRRERSGSLSVEDAWPLDRFLEHQSAEAEK